MAVSDLTPAEAERCHAADMTAVARRALSRGTGEAGEWWADFARIHISEINAARAAGADIRNPNSHPTLTRLFPGAVLAFRAWFCGQSYGSQVRYISMIGLDPGYQPVNRRAVGFGDPVDIDRYVDQQAAARARFEEQLAAANEAAQNCPGAIVLMRDAKAKIDGSRQRGNQVNNAGPMVGALQALANCPCENAVIAVTLKPAGGRHEYLVANLPAYRDAWAVVEARAASCAADATRTALDRAASGSARSNTTTMIAVIAVIAVAVLLLRSGK